MAIYLISFDMKASSHDYGPLYADLRAMNAHQAQASAWMIDANVLIRDLSNHFLGLIDKNDSLLIVEITGGTPRAATRLSEKTGGWLLKLRP